MSITAEEQQMLNDMDALKAHFEKQGFSYDNKDGTNDVHSSDAIDFFQRYFRSDLETLNIIKNKYKCLLKGR